MSRLWLSPAAPHTPVACSATPTHPFRGQTGVFPPGSSPPTCLKTSTRTPSAQSRPWSLLLRFSGCRGRGGARILPRVRWCTPTHLITVPVCCLLREARPRRDIAFLSGSAGTATQGVMQCVGTQPRRSVCVENPDSLDPGRPALGPCPTAQRERERERERSSCAVGARAQTAWHNPVALVVRVGFQTLQRPMQP